LINNSPNKPWDQRDFIQFWEKINFSDGLTNNSINSNHLALQCRNEVIPDKGVEHVRPPPSLSAVNRKLRQFANVTLANVSPLGSEEVCQPETEQSQVYCYTIHCDS
jgi:hypothetical protein